MISLWKCASVSVALSILFTGCAEKSDATIVEQIFDHDENYIKVLSDHETTPVLGFFDLKVMSNNYIYSLALSAYTTKKLGYKYFTIVNINQDDELKKLFKMKQAITVEQRIHACTDSSEKGRFYTPSQSNDPNSLCDSIVLRDYNLHALGIRERHLPIMYYLIFSNKPIDKYLSFSANKVLENKEIQEYLSKRRDIFESDKKRFEKNIEQYRNRNKS